MNARALIAAAAILAGAASAQQASGLGGPAVPVSAPSLIERTFSGEVVMPTPNPESAALALLTLSEAERAKTNAVLLARNRILDQFVAGHLDLLTKIGVAMGGNDKADQVNLLLEAAAYLRPLVELGPLQDRLRECLTPEHAKTFDAMLRDFWAAYCAGPMKTPKPDGKLPNRFEVMTDANLKCLGKEIEACVGRMVTSGDLVFDLLFKGVTLKPDQRAKLHELVDEFTERTKGNATDKENVTLFFSILPVLDGDDQRRTFIGNVRSLGGKPPKTKAEKPMSADETP
jgi:hypothetical protein